MNPQVATTKIEQWNASGELSPESVLQRVDEEIEEYSGIDQEEVAALHNIFAKQDNSQGLTQGIFASILQEKITLSTSSNRTEAEQIIFNVLAYLSMFPFPGKYPAANSSLPTALSQKQLTRGLVWLLPGRSETVCKGGSFTRSRTPADRRRLLFQSLASTTTQDKLYDPVAARERAEENSKDTAAYAVVNHDEDGDEMFHDMLDVLCAVQPEHRPLAPIHRNAFRRVVKSMPCSKDKVFLYALAIPRQQFTVLMEYLLVVENWYENQKKDPEPADIARLQGQVKSLVDEFCESSEEGLITWPKFDNAIKAHKV